MNKKIVLLSLLSILIGLNACRIGKKETEVKNILKPSHFVFQNFDDGTGFSSGNSGAVTSVFNTEEGGATRSIMFDVINTGGPGNDLNCVIIYPQSNQPVDVSGYRYLSFFLKDNYGEAAYTVTIIDSNGSEWFGWVDVDTKSDSWRNVSMPLDFAGNDIDLSSVSEIRIGEWRKGIFHIDDISFISSESGPVSEVKKKNQLSFDVKSKTMNSNDSICVL